MEEAKKVEHENLGIAVISSEEIVIRKHTFISKKVYLLAPS
jgi:hypothetical protein